MSKKMEIVKHYLVPIFIILAVFGCCTFFLLENIPHSADDLDVNYSSKKIVINNDLLLTDVVGKNISEDNLKVGTTGYVEFEVSSKLDEKVKYEVVLTKENASPEIPLEYVKVYLTASVEVRAQRRYKELIEKGGEYAKLYGLYTSI